MTNFLIIVLPDFEHPTASFPLFGQNRKQTATHYVGHHSRIGQVQRLHSRRRTKISVYIFGIPEIFYPFDHNISSTDKVAEILTIILVKLLELMPKCLSSEMDKKKNHKNLLIWNNFMFNSNKMMWSVLQKCRLS